VRPHSWQNHSCVAGFHLIFACFMGPEPVQLDGSTLESQNHRGWILSESLINPRSLSTRDIIRVEIFTLRCCLCLQLCLGNANVNYLKSRSQISPLRCPDISRHNRLSDFCLVVSQVSVKTWDKAVAHTIAMNCDQKNNARGKTGNQSLFRRRRKSERTSEEGAIRRDFV
jgi:hypothetical protein